MSDGIRLSVALVTRNRPDSLRRCLESLRAQNEQPQEVIVSDDSDDEFAPETRRISGFFDCRWVSGPHRGLYANRNFAASQCTGTHIRTMDDDHTFSAGHFAQCLAAVRSDPQSVWTTGEMGFIQGEFYDKVETARQLHASGVGCPVEDLDNNWAVADGSTIYPAEIFESGLRMVEEFDYGSSYLEFGAFLYQHGFRSRCVRGAWVEHHAGMETLAPVDLRSRLFASLCFNLHFRRNRALAAKYLISYALLRQPNLILSLHPMLEKVRARWSPAK